MASDASAALGAPQVAGTFVNAKGFAKRAAAGALGGAIGAAVATATAKPQADMPAFSGVAYVAASADEVAIIKTKAGLLKRKITDEVLARRPRGELSSIALKRGTLMSGLTLNFNDGSSWVFDVPKASQRGAIQLVEALGGAVS